jgi:23S rRNA pseudouridine2605 synthase
MSKNTSFQKFIDQKSNAARKEAFKQEKKVAKKERSEAIDKRFEEKRKQKALITATKNTIKDPAANTAATPTPASTNSPAAMPLNKFIAHCGICSRRDAAELIKKGEVKVNQAIILDPGTKVNSKDVVQVKGKTVKPNRNFVYILLNKPKDYITTSEDPQGRKTVLDLIKQATKERVYPIGRLDRNTSGVLLLTNDGDMAQTLSHPKHEIKKLYEVTLNKPFTKADFEKLSKGLLLADGFIKVDALGYTEPNDKSVIGVEIHSGRNRIVRRIFEFLGYDVRGLDRVMYAGLTKKNVQRGNWRLLTEKEIRILRHFNPQTKKT